MSVPDAVLVQASSFGAPDVRVRPKPSISVGARPAPSMTSPAAPVALRARRLSASLPALGALNTGTMSPGLKVQGRTRTVALGRVTSNNRSREP